MNLYIKAKFYEPIKNPLYGFAIKTLDGIFIYGSNTRFSDAKVCAVDKGDIVVFKFSISMDLAPGYFFIDLGLAEGSKEKDIPLDIREAIICLYVLERRRFDGLVEFKTSCEELKVYKEKS